MVDERDDKSRESSNAEVNVVDWRDLVRVFAPEYEFEDEEEPAREVLITVKKGKGRR